MVMIVLFCIGTEYFVSLTAIAAATIENRKIAAVMCTANDVLNPNGRSRLYSLVESVVMGI